MKIKLISFSRIFLPLWLQREMQSSTLVNIWLLWTGMSDFFPTPLFCSLPSIILLYCKSEVVFHEILSFRERDYMYCFVSSDSNLCCCKLMQSCSQIKAFPGTQPSYYWLWSHRVQSIFILNAKGRSVINTWTFPFCFLRISTICRNGRFSFCVF